MWAYRPKLRPAEIHPALHSFADECTAVIGRLLAYVGAIALIAIVGNQLLANLPVAWEVASPAGPPGWSPAARSYPAFAVTQFDKSLKTEAYDILRHPEGGRKDIMRWAPGPGDKPVAELELYRPGAEIGETGSAVADLASRIDPDKSRDIAAAGVIDSKFGYVRLLDFAGEPADGRTCLGFHKNFDDLRISGWFCQPGPAAIRRTAIGCMLDHLILLTAGNDAKLAELFARAELKRGACRAAATSTASADWIAGPHGLRLRGSF
jgi:hypothetical protein